MIRNLVRSKCYILMGAAILLTGLFAAGCATSSLENNGKMTNQTTSKHVKGYQMSNSQAITPVMPLRALR
ncbi:MAG TPA: hypothetical protein VFL79_17030 [Terriglobia bacterium]|nr:hypothetical protein [Terriglobia bacterium]